FPMGRGKRATMFAALGSWNADERSAIEKSMDETYQVFVKRVADGRGKTPEQIQQIAQGRVWTGAKAKELGLVDEPELLRLGAGPHAALRDLLDLLGRLAAAVGDPLDEHLIRLVHRLLDRRPFVGVPRAERGEHRRALAAAHRE